MIRTLAHALATGALLLAAPLAAAPHPGAGSQLADAARQPAVWLLEDADTRIWLFGTNHVLPSDLQWRSADLDAIIADADELVLEVSADDEAALKPERIMRLMRAAEPRPILDRISPQYRNGLREIIKYSSLTTETLDGLETWAVGFLLMSLSFQDMYGVPGSEDAIETTGVEEILTGLFEAQDKPISGVETSVGQINFFRNLSEEAQRGFLEGMVSGPSEEEAEATEDEILAGWRVGDVATLDSECDDPEAFPPEIHEVLLTRRNANWTNWLIDRLDRPGDVLFAVGACHLAGRDAVQHMLAGRGFTARRVH